LREDLDNPLMVMRIGRKRTSHRSGAMRVRSMRSSVSPRWSAAVTVRAERRFSP
jgi:hypothetical protein